LYKVKYLHTLRTPESERLKVTALNLFRPTAPPPFEKVSFFHIATQPPGGEEKGAGATSFPTSWAVAWAMGAWGIQVVRYVSFQGL
jgi:hypothetical protein